MPEQHLPAAGRSSGAVGVAVDLLSRGIAGGRRAVAAAVAVAVVGSGICSLPWRCCRGLVRKSRSALSPRPANSSATANADCYPNCTRQRLRQPPRQQPPLQQLQLPLLRPLQHAAPTCSVLRRQLLCLSEQVTALLPHSYQPRIRTSHQGIEYLHSTRLRLTVATRSCSQVSSPRERLQGPLACSASGLRWSCAKAAIIQCPQHPSWNVGPRT